MSNKKLSLKHRREMRLLKSGEKTKSNKVLEGKPKALDFLETTEALEDDEDKENGSPSFRRPTNLSRRNSTILAGNLSILDPDNPFHPSLREDYVTGRKPRRKPSIKYTNTAAAAETTASDSVMTDDLSWRRRDQMVEVTEEDEEEEEDDATFHTCRETLQVADVGVCRGDESWLTDITTLRMEDMKISNSENMKITDSAYDKALQVVSQQDQSQSFRLQLSESEASKGGFSNAHDEGSKKVDTDMEAITRNSSRKVAATPKTGVGVKASAFFSIGKRNDDKAGKNSNLLAKGSDGSDTSDDEEIVMSPKKLQFGDKSPNGLRSRMEKPTEKTVVFASESEDSEHEEKVETPQPNFLSQSRFASINSWVAKSPFHANITANLGDLSRVEKINDWVANSPFQDNSIADINDLLLTSDEDEPVAKGKIETPVNYQNDHRKMNEKTVQSKVNSKTISQIALEQLNSIGIKSNKFKGVLKSKENSQIESNVSSNAVSIHRKNDGGENCMISEISNATSKHQGSWQDSRVTSDRTNVQSEEKSSMDAVENDETGDGAENSQAHTERSSKAGCNWEDSQHSYFEGLEKSKSCTERTSKAGGSLEESQPCTEKTGELDSSLKESQPNTDRSSKAGGSVEESKPCEEKTGQFDASLKESQPIIERTSKVGVNWEESKPFNTERTSKYVAGMVPRQSSVREENQNKKPLIVIESSGDSDDNLDNFLAKIISKNKSPLKNNEDLSKFIVGDGNLKESQPNTQRTSIAGGSWEESQQLNTERTSKADGSWEESQPNTERTSKAGGSWEESQPNTERTSKAGGSWEESQPNRERTSKAGGSWEESQQRNTERTSKAGGSWEESQPNTEITSKANGSREKSQPNTDSTYKVGRNWEESQLITQRTSKAGGSWEESSPNTDQACEAGSWEESQPNKIGASCDEYQVNTGISDGCLIEIPEIGANGKSQSDSERTSKTIIRCEDSKAKSRNEVFNSAGDDNSNWEDEESHLRTVEFEKSIPKSTSSTSAFKTPKPKTSKNSNQVSKTYKVDESNKKNETNTSITWGPLENSRHGNVNTVRSWEDVRGNSVPNKECSPGNLDLKRNVSKKSVNKVKPGKKNMDNNSEASLVPSHSSVRVDNQNKKPPPIVIESSGDSDDNLDNFLAKITSKNKSPTKTNEDLSKFIVADEDVDSDEFATPKLSLKDRIMKGNVTDEVNTSSYRSKTQIPESESDDELPEIQPNPKKGSKPKGKRGKLRLPSSNETSENDEDDSPLVTRPIRKTGTAKKAYVIDSDSESSKHSDNDSPYYSDAPVNIYEPGQYHKIPSPSSPPRARLPVPKSIYRPVSPVKTKTSRPPPKTGVKSTKVAVGKNQINQLHTPTLTFLSSLTSDTPIHRCHPEAKKYLTKFNNSKVELSKRLYQLYNTECFDSCLPSDFEISWNVRLTKTAGLCYSRRYRDRHGIEVRSSRIELSTKVIDSCDRLRDTLIHEMCHAASWIISGYRDGHGPLWKTWASKAMARFPELPVIDRCHSYAIRTKYTYKCEKCGYCIGRHSKSLDTARKVCGHCHGTFQLVVNYKGKVTDDGNCPEGAGISAAKTPKTPNPFALFVKENYKNYKKPGVSHGDVMKMLGDKFKEAKISNK